MGGDALEHLRARLEVRHRHAHRLDLGHDQHADRVGDRTVGGLTVRDQMVGPWQTPVADVAVTATGFEATTGEAMAMGERPTIALLDAADVLLEGFRPGVMERLGLGPDIVGARNPRLIYGRMTGWGQTGPLAGAVGHDLNFVAVAGALGASGTPLFVVGNRVLNGAVGYEALKEAIAEARNRRS